MGKVFCVKLVFAIISVRDGPLRQAPEASRVMFAASWRPDRKD